MLEFFFIIWIGLPNDVYIQYDVNLVNYDIPGAIGDVNLLTKTITIESKYYPFSLSGCDVLLHEVRHVQLAALGYSGTKHHGIMEAEGTFC